ncbi:hypothetical protein EZ449_22100 [Pedobacter frigidisoli]|uniref:Uncharacterized protein n=1 Tax=Pedobacter frigidisoli TaxID=2530455 RepID=A0A4V2MK52_9SPHI|nr:hypothetical protein [Pedobacter frigidisoli]TCC96886.1 hypothetical protein EZ449_22100 [Pedobacter frigidisoli]
MESSFSSFSVAAVLLLPIVPIEKIGRYLAKSGLDWLGFCKELTAKGTQKSLKIYIKGSQITMNLLEINLSFLRKSLKSAGEN